MDFKIAQEEKRVRIKMKPSVLLIFQAPRKRNLYVNTLPPLGILSIASFLQRNNILLDVFDFTIQNRLDKDLKNYDVVGLSLNMANISTSLETIRYIKKQNPDAKVIIGGPSCISNPLYFTNNENIDAICTGEGEEAFLDYIVQGAFIDGKEIAGLYTRKNKHFVYGGERQHKNNLDEYPFPALDKVMIHKYNTPLRKRFPVSSIMTSRGCPFHCTFCFHSMGHEWRARSCINVVDEMEWQVKELGVKEICIQDDNFSLDIKRAKQIFDLIIKRDIMVKLQFPNGLRVDFIELDLLDKMFHAGVWLIGVAPETGSPELMKKIKKCMDLEKVAQVVQWCRKIGINTYANFMIGFPAETMQDLRKTASFIKKLNPDFIQITRVISIPGTPLYETVTKDDFRNMFGQEQGTFFGVPKLIKSEMLSRDAVRWIKKMHTDFYLNPLKIFRLMTILSPAQLIRLFIYSLRTGNIW
ncbi:MAG: radical SAM protein [Candidatus Omnitrophota bacterium]